MINCVALPSSLFSFHSNYSQLFSFQVGLSFFAHPPGQRPRKLFLWKNFKNMLGCFQILPYNWVVCALLFTSRKRIFFTSLSFPDSSLSLHVSLEGIFFTSLSMSVWRDFNPDLGSRACPGYIHKIFQLKSKHNYYSCCFANARFLKETMEYNMISECPPAK